MTDRVRIREWLITAGPAILLVAAAFGLTAIFIKPAPPDVVVMSAGREGGAYWRFAEAYREVLARDNILLDLRPSAGSHENVNRLTAPDSEYSVALVQSGVGNRKQSPHLLSLGHLFYEPLWVVHRLPGEPQHLTALKGRRVVIGPEGSGTRDLALSLLAANGITADNTRLLDLGTADAAAALIDGRADAAFFVSAPEAETIQRLLKSPTLKLMSFAQADAYARRFTYLSHVELREGVIDLPANIPPRDIRLVAPMANLVVRDDLHPALVVVLAQAAAEVHGESTLLNAAGAFPRTEGTPFPLSRDAARYYKSGPPFLQRYLPFWAAVLVDRLLLLLLPVITILLPLFKIVPLVYTWRVRRRLYHWYRELKALEQRIELREAEPRDALTRLEEIETAVSHIPIPLSFSDQHYQLRTHIDLVRRNLTRRVES